MNEKISILNDLGDPDYLDIEDNSKWPDYLQYNFTESDVPDLIAILLDEELYESPTGENGKWLHLHTWRTLGQLKAVDAIDPLISSFDFFSLVEDNSAFKELPEVITMIGEPAIKAVANNLLDFSTSTHSRFIANDVLGGIAKAYPNTRDEVLAIYKDYLSAPDCMASRLNAYVIIKLLDLKAVKLIDDISPLFEKNCVELSLIADMETVKSRFLQE